MSEDAYFVSGYVNFNKLLQINSQSTRKKMCILYQWGQIDPSRDSYFGVVFVVFFKNFFLFST